MSLRVAGARMAFRSRASTPRFCIHRRRRACAWVGSRKLSYGVGLREVLRGTFASIHALEVQRAAMDVAVSLRFTPVAIRRSKNAPRDTSMAGWCRAERSSNELTKTNQLIASCDRELECMCLAARTEFGPTEAVQLESLVRDGLDWSMFLAQFERHYVAPLVLRSLNSIGGAGLPRECSRRYVCEHGSRLGRASSLRPNWCGFSSCSNIIRFRSSTTKVQLRPGSSTEQSRCATSTTSTSSCDALT